MQIAGDVHVDMNDNEGIAMNGIGNDMGSNTRKPYIKILEQPASKALRFRYECEGRSAGSIPGVHNTPENKTYPTIQIVGYKGKTIVVVSCVTKDLPYRAHPHNLVGKEGCKKGICSMEINNENMTATFSNLGIQCVKKKDIEEALKVRQEIKVDPFKQGFQHAAHPSSIDLNSVRLCFQAFIETTKPKKFEALEPVVSDPIYDKKAMSDLVITRLSHTSAPVIGGQEVILLCEKVAKEDIHIRFYEEVDGQVVWESYGEFGPTQVHKQVAIAFKTPPYRNTEVKRTVKAFIQLRRPSDGATSDPLPFNFTPYESDFSRPRKTPKMWDDLRQLEQQTQNQVLFGSNTHAAQPFPVKSEPCTPPDFMFPNSPSVPGGSPNISPYNEDAAQSTFTNSPVMYQQGKGTQLPAFSDLPNPRLKVESVAQGQMYWKPQYINNMTLYNGGSVMPAEFNSEFMRINPPSTNAEPLEMYPQQMSMTNAEMSFCEDKSSNPVASLEMKIDSNDLVKILDSRAVDASELSENLSQSLNISDFPAEQNSSNMMDSLTRLANEAFETNFNKN